MLLVRLFEFSYAACICSDYLCDERYFLVLL